MTKIKFNTQNIATIQNELELLNSKIQEAINYGNQNIIIPNGFRKDDVLNAISSLENSKRFIAKTSKWINTLKQNYQNVTEENHVRLSKMDDKFLTEKGLIVK